MEITSYPFKSTLNELDIVKMDEFIFGLYIIFDIFVSFLLGQQSKQDKYEFKLLIIFFNSWVIY